MFFTDAEKIRFILLAEAGLHWLLDNDENLSAEAKTAERPKYITNYIGSKQKLIDWIWANTPDNAHTAVDAFSGSSVVGYMYKSKGLAVHSCDRLRYCHHIARAIVENDSVTLSEEEIEGLLSDSGHIRDFVRKHFGGVYFEPGVHKLIDIVRSNTDRLKGYKKDIALFALGKTCITAKGGFGHFGTTKKQDNRADSPAQFKERFAKNCQRINALIFEGEKSCKAHHGDTRKLLGKVNADVAYFDPPYATQFSQTNYERAYHFVEGLMTWWEGKDIRKDSTTRAYDIPTEVTKANAKSFFEEFLGAAKHIPHWIISYRDQAYPSEAEIKTIVGANGKSSRMKSKTHQYQISAQRSEHSQAREHLFVCAPGGAKANVEHTGLEVDGNPTNESFATEAQEAHAEHADVQDARTTGNHPIHTRIPSMGGMEFLSAKAEQSGDKRFKFILTHVGTNRNGDHFTAEELQRAAETAIGKKIDLSHSQEFRDIVGGIVEANYIDDGENSRIECVGELFTAESEPARLAYKLMKRGIVTHVSMECDYQEGECSICGKTIASKAEYCSHLKNFKGRKLKGKPCFEILRGVTFTGMGLLDRDGADERAEIRQVASQTSIEGETEMSDEKTKETKAAETPPEPDGMSEAEKEKLIKKQQSEIEKLMKELDAVKKQLDDSQATHRAVVRKAKAEKLLSLWEDAGREFGDESARANELDRLMKLSDEAFSATEETVSAIAATRKPKKTDEDDEEPEEIPEDDLDSKKTKKKPRKKGNLSSDARERHTHAPDSAGATLADKLTQGFMAAYKDRAGIPAE